MVPGLFVTDGQDIPGISDLMVGAFAPAFSCHAECLQQQRTLEQQVAFENSRIPVIDLSGENVGERIYADGSEHRGNRADAATDNGTGVGHTAGTGDGEGRANIAEGGVSAGGGNVAGTGTDIGAGDDPGVGAGAGTDIEGDTVAGAGTDAGAGVGADSGMGTEASAEETVASEDELSSETGGTSPVGVNPEKLKDFDYLLQHYYLVDASTTVNSSILNAEELLAMDMTIKEGEGPKVLVYHTHSQECFADSKSKSAEESVVAVGEYLTELLQEKYGIETMHHTGTYDVNDRDHAYSNAAGALKQILDENPSIEVVIDVHRDSVGKDKHLVTEINGKPTAKIMFFNGLSRTTARGELSYLANPNLSGNLAFSLQLQLEAEKYYPNFTRHIYLKGYRYNMHYCPKSLLVEVGAESTTLEEAKNAMEPLADILAKVLLGQK